MKLFFVILSIQFSNSFVGDFAAIKKNVNKSGRRYKELPGGNLRRLFFVL